MCTITQATIIYADEMQPVRIPWDLRTITLYPVVSAVYIAIDGSSFNTCIVTGRISCYDEFFTFPAAFRKELYSSFRECSKNRALRRSLSIIDRWYREINRLDQLALRFVTEKELHAVHS